MASIASALRRIKGNPLDAGVLDRATVQRLCREHGHAWRDRELDPATTVALFLQQVLHGNVPCSDVRHLAAAAAAASAAASSSSSSGSPSFTPQAYCQARARLPLAVCQALLYEVHQHLVEPALGQSQHLWLGLHRTFLIDGSTLSMPDTPELRAAFGPMPSGQAEGCGFPVAHLLALFNAGTGMLIDCWAAPRLTGDLAEAPEAHLHLDEGDVLVGDDMFGGYAHLALLQSRGLHGLFPSHHLRIVDFKKGRPHASGSQAAKGVVRSRWIRSLGKEDQLVELFKRDSPRPAWMSQADYQALPESIVVRELRRTVVRPGMGKLTITLTTTLLDPERYPAAELLELRLRRWDVETCLGHLKTTMGLDVLRCKSEQGVRKELAMICLAYNLVRAVMLEAAGRQGVAVSRISFADAYRWMRRARPGQALPRLLVNPWRPWRFEPRCRKRRPKQYDLMNKPRAVLRKQLENQRKIA